MKPTFLLPFLTIVLLLAVTGCRVFDRGSGETHDQITEPLPEPPPVQKVSNEFSDGNFRITMDPDGNKWTSFSMINKNADSFDLFDFGQVLFQHSFQQKTKGLAKGKPLTEEDVKAMYFCFDIMIRSLNDVESYLFTRMTPHDKHLEQVPQDFVMETPTKNWGSIDLSGLGRNILIADKVSVAAKAKDNLRAKRRSSSTTMEHINAWGASFTKFSPEAFDYNKAIVIGEIDPDNRVYFKPNFKNLWNTLPTKDPSLELYTLLGDNTLLATRRDLVDKSFYETSFPAVSNLLSAVTSYVGKTVDLKSRDSALDIIQEFSAKNGELIQNYNLLMVDLPFILCCKETLNKVDRAKHTFNDDEKAMEEAFNNFWSFVGNKNYFERLSSDYAKDLFEQLKAKLRLELGDKRAARLNPILVQARGDKK